MPIKWLILSLNSIQSRGLWFLLFHLVFQVSGSILLTFQEFMNFVSPRPSRICRKKVKLFSLASSRNHRTHFYNIPHRLIRPQVSTSLICESDVLLGKDISSQRSIVSLVSLIIWIGRLALHYLFYLFESLARVRPFWPVGWTLLFCLLVYRSWTIFNCSWLRPLVFILFLVFAKWWEQSGKTEPSFRWLFLFFLHFLLKYVLPQFFLLILWKERMLSNL